ncbi:MAG: hypothetical protein CM15mV3_1970 [Caudoviricetes sp.]|nr:MAG: hypothetical protein CM15mV3_1970 [Caudoviricetes sp.]
MQTLKMQLLMCCIVAAAGNDNFNVVLDGEADWNNFVRITG